MEHTISFNTQESLNLAHALKTEKYEGLVCDLETMQRSSHNALDIGALG